MSVDFGDAVAGSSFVEDGRYLVKLIGLEEQPPHPEYGVSVKWTFHVWDYVTHKQVKDDRGFAYEFHQFSSKPKGGLSPKSKARKWFEALLDRSIVDGERGSEIVTGAMGKNAIAMIAANEKQQSRIVTLTPAKTASTTKAAAAPPPEPPDSVFEESEEQDPFA